MREKVVCVPLFPPITCLGCLGCPTLLYEGALNFQIFPSKLVSFVVVVVVVLDEKTKDDDDDDDDE